MRTRRAFLIASLALGAASCAQAQAGYMQPRLPDPSASDLAQFRADFEEMASAGDGQAVAFLAPGTRNNVYQVAPTGDMLRAEALETDAFFLNAEDRRAFLTVVAHLNPLPPVVTHDGYSPLDLVVRASSASLAVMRTVFIGMVSDQRARIFTTVARRVRDSSSVQGVTIEGYEELPSVQFMTEDAGLRWMIDNVRARQTRIDEIHAGGWSSSPAGQ